MSDEFDIRASLPEDGPALEALYGDAFPDEDLIPLLRDLLNEKDGVLSRVATRNGAPVGHIVFTKCGVDGHTESVALLGPLAVSPGFQRRGIGSALIRDGLERMTIEGAARVLVLGDPAYYGRFGFQTESEISPPYALPEDWRTAWQSMGLKEAPPDMKGTLSVPHPWHQKALWAP